MAQDDNQDILELIPLGEIKTRCSRISSADYLFNPEEDLDLALRFAPTDYEGQTRPNKDYRQKKTSDCK